MSWRARVANRFAPIGRWVHRNAVTVFVVVVLGSMTTMFYIEYRLSVTTKREANARITAQNAVERRGTYGNCHDLQNFRDGVLSLVDKRSPQRIAANLTLADPTASPTQKQRASVLVNGLDQTLTLLVSRLPAKDCGRPPR